MVKRDVTALTFLPCENCGHASVCRKAGECVLLEPVVRRFVASPARTLQPGDRTPAGVVKYVVPSSGVLGIIYEEDPMTTWRIHPDSPVQIEVA